MLCVRAVALLCVSVSGQLLPPWSTLLAAPSLTDSGHDAEHQDSTSPVPSEEIHGPYTLCGDERDVQYSGYLDAGPNTSYFFFLSRKRPSAPRDAPLLLWLNGGPGCSSLMALVFENGPCSVTPDRSGYGKHRNPHSWTEVADVLWVEQPAQVGFSRGETLARGEGDVATHMLAFLQRFYVNFPEFREQRFFIVGESYAGHYVPAIAASYLRAGGSLAGVGLGNALVNIVPDMATSPDMAFTGGEGGSLGHGVVNRSTYEAMLRAKPGCIAAFEAAQEKPSLEASVSAFTACDAMTAPIISQGLNPYDLRMRCGGTDNNLCYPTADQEAFFNDPQVRRTLGVEDGSAPWKACSNTVFAPFMISGDIARSFEGDVATVLEAGVPILVYHGDTDYMCHWLGGKRWATNLPWSQRGAWATEVDVDFVVDSSVAGRQRTLGGFTFLQIFNSGHMVPMDQPVVSLEMIRNFVSPSSPWGIARDDTMLASVVATSLRPVLIILALIAAAVPAMFFTLRAKSWRGIALSEPLCAEAQL